MCLISELVWCSVIALLAFTVQPGNLGFQAKQNWGLGSTLEPLHAWWAS